MKNTKREIRTAPKGMTAEYWCAVCKVNVVLVKMGIETDLTLDEAFEDLDAAEKVVDEQEAKRKNKTKIKR